ncbi:bifunctional 3,4-dihydroxy-2-butanone-4-phosphate synthase/GTP cyclohydrolase II [Phytoactinopolyspora mesophila]|uniref:Riboflavin biosynthesis protein RibBA n=1 Tax=Phytoactinopolyspora mesophila TaxID=2650750 RepID=A0A7K3LZI0_9ACTN|nr:bifunctional 3,4-dihydroxy-2-butanone-4-phosphate synthase/GTP cyclohydrolase II [Phytoactinopolyspora mesophila]NDL55628.1 bifunctional 3,4-dihydroxy-2-butanone-4-phosphate synthase/GTP cyclohydrolase II [Phytoactinopolyspora mesophila]
MGEAIQLDSVERAIKEIAAGRAVVVVDDEDRENEGDLIFAAARATPELMGFTIRYSSGVICVPMIGSELDRLKLPPMTAVNEDRKGTAYAVSVDARHGVSTGISASDRAHTAKVLADSATEAYELTRPGHVFPLRAKEGGVLRRAGHTEAGVDLARLAGFSPAAVLCEVVHDDGSMMRAPALREFADEHGLAMISIADLIRYRQRTERQVERIATTRLPTMHGDFRAYGYRDLVGGGEHLALVKGELSGDDPVLARIHSECLTGDAFGSLRCDCGPQLQAALAAVAKAGRGVVVYLRGHEGRGIGLAHKLQAYELQDNGHDTVDANIELGLPADARDYGVGAQILADLGVRSLALMTNNPAKLTGIEGYGLDVAERVGLPVTPQPENLRYLRTKRDRLGHDLPGLDGQPAADIEQGGSDVELSATDELEGNLT